MTETDQTHEGPRVSAEEMRDVDRLRRSRNDRYVAGVAGGLGRHFDVDPTIIRVAFVVLSFFGGAGLLLYAAGALLIPAEDSDHATVDVTSETRRILLLGALAIAFLVSVGGAWKGFGYFWPVGVLVAIGVIVLVSRDRRRLARQTTDPGEQSSTPPPTAAAAPSAAPPEAPSATPPAAWWTPRVGGYTPPPPKPPKTGPVWLWPTLAMIAIGMGVLGIIDASHTVTNGAYPALALAITGVMTLVGAFAGRPGGLIFTGLVCLVALSVTAVLGNGFDTRSQTIDVTPTSAAQVADDYSTSTGRIHLDLTRIVDPAALDGREIDVHLKAGDITVTVPREVTVDLDAEVKLAGDIAVEDHDIDHGGFDPHVTTTLPGTSPAVLHLDLHSRVGQITVRQQ